MHLFDGPDANVVKEAVNTAISAYIEKQHGLGNNIALSGVYAALHQPGVARVELSTPTTDLLITSKQAPFNTAVNIELA